MAFENRIDAGRQLAARLREYAGRSDVLVLACRAAAFRSPSKSRRR